MFGLVINIILLLFWSLYLYFINRKNAIIRNGICIGIIGSIVYSIFLEGNIVFVLLIIKYNIGSFLEEGIKFFLLILYPFWTDITQIESYVLGASIGLGFGFIENLYLLENYGVLLIRGLIGNVLQMTTTLISAFGIYSYKKTDRKEWLLLYFISVFIHELYNYVVTMLTGH